MRYESHINNIEPIIKAYEYYLSNNESQKKVCEKFNLNYSAFVRYVGQFKGGYNRNFKVEVKKIPVTNLRQYVEHSAPPKRTANNRAIAENKSTEMIVSMPKNKSTDNATEMIVSMPKNKFIDDTTRITSSVSKNRKIDSKGHAYMPISPSTQHVAPK
jgi:hypothetical protein